MNESLLRVFFVNGQKFEEIELLGKGTTCETWLVTDGEKEYALKKIRDTFSPTEVREFLEKSKSDYEILKEAGIPIPKLLEIDYEAGIILKEYIPGEVALNHIVKGSMPDNAFEQLKEINDKVACVGMCLDFHCGNFVVNNDRLVYIDYACFKYELGDEFKIKLLKSWQRNTPEFAQVFYNMVMKFGD